jgi:hypothetical protein
MLTIVREVAPEMHVIGSHAWQGFNPSYINLELYHYTDDAIRMTGVQSQ